MLKTLGERRIGLVLNFLGQPNSQGGARFRHNVPTLTNNFTIASPKLWQDTQSPFDAQYGSGETRGPSGMETDFTARPEPQIITIHVVYTRRTNSHSLRMTLTPMCCTSCSAAIAFSVMLHGVSQSVTHACLLLLSRKRGT